MTNKTVGELELLLKHTADWNGRYGLIVPKNVAEILSSMGLKNGYTTNKKLKLADFKGVTK